MKKQQIPNLDFKEHFLSSPEYCTAAQHFLFVRHVGLWCFQATLKILTVVLALVGKKKKTWCSYMLSFFYIYKYLFGGRRGAEKRKKE